MLRSLERKPGVTVCMCTLRRDRHCPAASSSVHAAIERVGSVLYTDRQQHGQREAGVGE